MNLCATVSNSSFLSNSILDLNKKIKYFKELHEFGYKITSEFDLEEPLTKRELEVLSHIVKGKTYRRIAELLFISEYTVQSHARHIYRKLGVSSRSEAVAKAIRHKIIEEGL